MLVRLHHRVFRPLLTSAHSRTALAFQLLQAEQAFKSDFADSKEVHALDRGLGLMTTVLNDVLDFESEHMQLSHQFHYLICAEKKWMPVTLKIPQNHSHYIGRLP